MAILAVWLITGACGKSFLKQSPQGQLTDEQVNSVKGVEDLLIGAYGLVNGNVNGTWGNYGAAPSQWLFGEVAADDAHKGSIPSDQATMLDIEKHIPNSNNEHLTNMWDNYYEGVTRCNATLRTLATVQQKSEDKFSDERAKEIEGEAKMLRGHYYFYLWRIFKHIPYIDETLSTEEAAKVPNDADVLPMIEADFKFAAENLPVESPMGEKGRVNQIAAKAYLGKVYLYEKKYDEALPLFKEVMAARPDLVDIPFLDNFDVNTENGPGSIFAAQHVINPDGTGDNANVGDMLGGLYGSAPVNCCGFFNPSIDLVNAYQLTAQGLPKLDDSYRDDPYLSDLELSDSERDDYKVNQKLAFDPRLDYTVGRRGVPYHDWGVMPGGNWIRDMAVDGPFVASKQMIDQADFSGNTSSTDLEITSLNVNIIRLAGVYLMAAECAAETGDLPYALELVNSVRKRAAKIPHKKINGKDAAIYNVQPYPSFPDKAYAMKAIRFERRLELALEGQRFFDLVRWGIAEQVLNAYHTFEGSYISLYKGTTFDGEKDTYFPIPQEQIDRSGGVLVQNEGY